METPVLNKLQKKLSLSGKKKKKQVIKHILDNPYKSHWPKVTNELLKLKKTLQENLPKIKENKINVPWNVLKNVPRDERKNVRNEYIKFNSTPQEPIVKEENLIFGINDVTKKLENNLCSIVLIGEAEPRLLVNHVIELSVLYKTPILVIPGLKLITKDCCGIESIAIAITKNYTNQNLKKIVEHVTQISKNYPVDPNHINLNRSEIIKTITRIQEIEEKKKTDEIKINNFHLERKSMNERTFIPVSSTQKTQKLDEFMSFSEEKLTDETYKPLKVKRQKGNINRNNNNNKKIKRLKLTK